MYLTLSGERSLAPIMTSMIVNVGDSVAWVDHVVTARAIGYADGADAAGCTRVTIGGKSHAGFMRQCNDLERVRATELEEQIDDQISRDAEEMGNADLLEISDKVIAQFHFGSMTSSLPVKIIRQPISVNDQRS